MSFCVGTPAATDVPTALVRSPTDCVVARTSCSKIRGSCPKFRFLAISSHAVSEIIGPMCLDAARASQRIGIAFIRTSARFRRAVARKSFSPRRGPRQGAVDRRGSRTITCRRRPARAPQRAARGAYAQLRAWAAPARAAPFSSPRGFIGHSSARFRSFAEIFAAK